MARFILIDNVENLNKNSINALLKIIEEKLNRSVETTQYLIPHHRYDLIAKLRDQGCICTEEIGEVGFQIEATPRGKLASLLIEFIL